MWRSAALLLWLVPAGALAAPPIISAAPDSVAVTLYRDPDRAPGSAIDRDSPSSFALIAETRTVTLPPGEATVRFEGVASGIVPQSAILFGPRLRERNRDAALLSHKGLLDSFTGQQVVLRRTDPASGKQVEERARIRSSAAGVVIESPRGIEAVYCSGLAQTLIFPEAPATLSAKPVLSMTTRDQPGGTVTITLAYIATGFDWDASYVATLGDDGKALALLGWLTMASGDDTSFADATTSAVAGKVNRSADTRDDTGRVVRQEAESFAKHFGCWPRGTTSDPWYPPSPPVPASAPMEMLMEADGIMVTAMRRDAKEMNAPVAVTAVSEALGDLKLYRIPVPVTVAARSQKQVAFLGKDRVSGQLLYRSKAYGTELEAPQMLFRFRNRKADGIGEPLPAGKVVVYQHGPWGRMLVGEGSTPDKALDEEVEWAFGEPAQVTVEVAAGEQIGKRGRDVTATIRNANPFPVRYEIDFPLASGVTYAGLPGSLTARPGKRVWSAQVPANGTVRLAWRAVENDAQD